MQVSTLLHMILPITFVRWLLIIIQRPLTFWISINTQVCISWYSICDHIEIYTLKLVLTLWF